METDDVVLGLGALAQATRLEALRTLIRHAPAGLAAGDLARRLGVPQNTLSTHLNVLAHAGLVASTRQGRSIIYRADVARLGAILGFLLTDCCAGHPEVCSPVFVPDVPFSRQEETCL